MIKVYAYRKCSTCLKALHWLEEHHISFEEHPIKEDHPTYEQLKEWVEMSGLLLARFYNTSGKLYKEWNIKEKKNTMSEDEQLRLLSQDGMLVKRPLVIGDDFVLTGFKEIEWEEKLL